jgi:protein gp37
MGDKTGIEWTDATWNPTVGCQVVSPGCTNCYAMKVAARLEAISTAHQRDTGGDPGPMVAYQVTTEPSRKGPVWTGKVKVNPFTLQKPLTWKRPRRIFVNSMSDLFHEALSDEAIDQVFAVMALCPQHTFQVLTKRPERMKAYCTSLDTLGRLDAAIMRLRKDNNGLGPLPHLEPGDTWWPLANVWLGVSVEDQKHADARIPLLLQTPAAKRFLSCEPLLGPVNLTRLAVRTPIGRGRLSDDHLDCLIGERTSLDTGCVVGDEEPRIDWVIAGGESGPNARPMHPDWARALRDQCQAAGVPFFFKQWGEWAPVCALDLDAVYDRLYHPAPARDPEATRRPKVPAVVLHADGACRVDIAPDAYQAEKRPMKMFKTGKSMSGCLLDGREWSEFPAEGVA